MEDKPLCQKDSTVWSEHNRDENHEACCSKSQLCKNKSCKDAVVFENTQFTNLKLNFCSLEAHSGMQSHTVQATQKLLSLCL